MTDFAFEPATKDQAQARIALAGPSGSGKTWTALTIATRFGGPIAVVDTERGSASKYASDFAFDRLNLTSYDPRDLPKALAAAAQRAYAVVVVDSLSRFWSGTGGMLEQVDNAGKRGYGGNSFGGWKEARPMENAMIEALLGYPGHVIVTMRTKTAYEIVEDDRGRKVPTKIGLKPEQRDGIEYEFDIVGDMDLENTLTVSKTRCSALNGKVIRRPDGAVAEMILDWLQDGKPALDANAYRDLAVTEQDPVRLRELWGEVRAKGLYGAAVQDDTGETVTLGEFIARKGKEAIPARPVDQLPRNGDGSLSRSRTTDAEKAAAGVMTDAERKAATELAKGTDRGHVPRAVRSVAGQGDIPDDPWISDRASTTDVSPAAAPSPPARTATPVPAAGEAHHPGPAPAGHPAGREPAAGPGPARASTGQAGIIHTHFGRLGFGDDEREQRLVATAVIAGVESVTSTKDLDEVQARRVMDTLSRCRDRDALIALLAAGDKPGTGDG